MLNTWIAFFNSYFRQSQFLTDALQVQHTVFLRNLDQDLRKKMETKLLLPENASLPIFGPDPDDNSQTGSCMGLLIEHWRQNFPMLSRRLETFRLDQQEGQKYTDFLIELTRLTKTADLRTMSEDDIYIALALKDCKDPLMLEKLQEIPNLSNPNQLGQRAMEIERNR